MTQAGKAAFAFTCASWTFALGAAGLATVLEKRGTFGHSVTTIWVFAGFFAAIGVFFVLAVLVSFAEKVLHRPIGVVTTSPSVSSTIRVARRLLLVRDVLLTLVIVGAVFYAAMEDRLVAGIVAGTVAIALGVTMWWRRRTRIPG